MLADYSPVILAFASVSIVSGISLVCIFALLLSRTALDRLIPVLVALAIGALSGDALIHLLPESFRASTSSLQVSILALTGFFSAFLFEYWVNLKNSDLSDGKNFLGVRPPAIINLLASSAHNFIDGALIGSSFLESKTVGVATTLAIIFHEIPHELGDFGILVGSGLEVKKAIVLNFLSALIAILGTAIVVWVETQLQGAEIWVLPFTAGSFLYLAGPALLPPLLAHPQLRKDRGQLLAILVGITLMVILKVGGGS